MTMKLRLYNICSHIRAVLDDHKSLPHIPEISPGLLTHFPSGCCKYTAFIVMYYLNKYESVSIDNLTLLANANIGKGTHAWAKCHDYHLDITGDQFGGLPVWVDTRSPWPDSNPTMHPFADNPVNDHTIPIMNQLCDHIASRRKI